MLAHCECLECLECLRIVREKMRVGCDGWVGCYICMQPVIAIAAVHVSAIAIAAVIFSDCYRCSHFSTIAIATYVYISLPLMLKPTRI